MSMKYSFAVIAVLAATGALAVPHASQEAGVATFAGLHRHSYQKDSQPRIQGGEIVQGREFPWLVSVQLFGYHFSAGHIVNAEWILTTASSMFHGMTAYSIKAGTNKLDTGGTQHALTKVVLHEAYNESDSWVNDIALLKIHPPIEFTEGVSPVRLVEKGQETPVGTTATIAGWGATKYFEPPANDLHKLEVLIYDKDKCAEAYASVPKVVYPTQMCAESAVDRHGPTNGDSAVPVTVDGKVIGLTSWERNINELGWPFVCTDLASYIDWINEHIQE